MTGKLIFFFCSLFAASITSYLFTILQASGIQDRRMNGFKPLCFILPFWIILSAASSITGINYFPAIYTAKVVFVIIVPYLTVWFILHFIESPLIKYTAVKLFFIAIPALSVIAVLTNPWHRLYYLSYENLPPPAGPLYYAHIIPTISSIVFVYILLLKYIIQNYKKRPALIFSAIGVLMPLLFNLSYRAGVFGVDYDVSSMGYFVTILLFSYTFYASRLRKARLGVLKKTLEKITKSHEILTGSIQEAARFISRKSCIVLEAYRTGIWSYDEKSEILKSIICFDNLTQQYSIQDDFDLKNFMQYKELLLSEKIITINDVKQPNVLSSYFENNESNICSIMTAPIKIGERLAGIINFNQIINISFPEKREWNTEEQSFASSLAELMAVAFINEEKHILKEAEFASRAKSQFITNISHEIRTPMNAVLGMVEIALRENDINLKNEHLQVLKQSGIHLMSIISDILDFSKIESVKQEVVQEEYLITSLLDEIVNITSMGILGSKVRFAVKADNNIPRMLVGDEIKIRQTVLNLIDNAVKYTERGSISLGVYGEIVNNDTMNLIFTVSDTGIGIKPEDMDALFKDYKDIEYENDQVVEGAGLGLALAKNFVDAMGGKIDVYSEYGKGSIFTISLPQKYHSHEPMAVVHNPEGKSILIFERRDVYAESLGFTVKNLGTNCTIVSGGTELYEKMELKNYDYLFISFGLYKKNEDTIMKFGQKTEIIILTEFDEVISEKNLKTLTMPVYCTIIAEVLNGIYENILYSKGYESGVKFCAPDAHILVVDDIKTNLKVAQGLLAPYNMKVDLCINGLSAIESIHSEHYDLVFMDHRMPGIDGVEAVRRIRAWEKDQSLPPIPIVALTANAILGMKEMFLKNGFNDFLPKPIDTVQLNEILEKWIPRNKQKRH